MWPRKLSALNPPLGREWGGDVPSRLWGELHIGGGLSQSSED